MSMNPRLLRPLATTALPTDADARAYVLAVNAADGKALERAVVSAIDGLVIGLKADGVWADITHCCLLAGPRSIAGICVPLKGTAPTSNVFTTADLSRKTGLKGDASNTKYLDANVNHNTFSQDDFHYSFWVSEPHAASATLWLGGAGFNATGASNAFTSGGYYQFRNQNNSNTTVVAIAGDQSTGLVAATRSGSAGFGFRVGSGSSSTAARTSQTPHNGNWHIFRDSYLSTLFSTARIGWYSLGVDADLGSVQTRLSTYFASLAATNI